jgi:hypothetical protein
MSGRGTYSSSDSRIAIWHPCQILPRSRNAEATFQVRQSESVRSSDTVMPARGNKNATLRATCGPISACKTLSFSPYSARMNRGKTTRLRKKRVVVSRRSGANAGSLPSSSGLSHFAQKPSHGFLPAFAGHPIDPARQSWKPTSLGDSQPDQADSLAHQYPA